VASGWARAAEWDRGELRLELRGQLRELVTFTREAEPERLFVEGSARRSDAGLSLTRLRLDGQAAWRGLSGQVVYDSEFRTGSALDALPFRAGEAAGTATWLDADRTISDHDDGNLRHALYRAWVRWESERAEVTLGRQRIPLGRARLWNPADLFNPIPPLAVEGDQRVGVDAVQGRVRLADALWGGLIWAPQDDPDDHRAALRLERTGTGLDAAAMVARIRRDWVFGADAAGDLGGAAWRTEVTFTDHEPVELEPAAFPGSERQWQAVASIDYTANVGSGLYLLAEHLYNENRVDPDAIFAAPPLPPGPPLPRGVAVELGTELAGQALVELLARVTSASLHQSGLQAGYDLTPLVRADLLVIYEWSGASVAIAPALTWDVRSDLRVAAGARLFLGSGSSEYGEQANLVLVMLDAFF
jgi:hypothetical protein